MSEGDRETGRIKGSRGEVQGFLWDSYEFVSDKVRGVSTPIISSPQVLDVWLGSSKVGIRIGVDVSSRYVRIGFVFIKGLLEKSKELEGDLRSSLDEEVKVDFPKGNKRYAFAEVFQRR